jgi:hypothetical protein
VICNDKYRVKTPKIWQEFWVLHMSNAGKSIVVDRCGCCKSIVDSANTGERCAEPFERMAERLLGGTSPDEQQQQQQQQQGGAGVRRSMARRPTVTGANNEFAARASSLQRGVSQGGRTGTVVVVVVVVSWLVDRSVLLHRWTTMATCWCCGNAWHWSSWLDNSVTSTSRVSLSTMIIRHCSDGIQQQ